MSHSENDVEINDLKTPDASLTPDGVAKEPYEPWNDSYSLAVYLGAGATILVWIGVGTQKVIGSGGVNLLLLSAICMVIAVAVFMRGMSRQFGKVFEDKYNKKVSKVFAGTGYKVIPNKMTRVGDLDLLVEGPSEKLANVEIKSWRSYGDNSKFTQRERKAIKQIHSQRGVAAADVSVLWLPQSNQSWLKAIFNPYPKIDNGIYLCCGNERRLRSLLKKILK